MKEGMDLQTLATTVLEHASGKKDLVAPTSALSFDRNDGGAIRLAVGSEKFDLNPTAASQVVDFLGVPRRFAARINQEIPDLLIHNYNELMRNAKGRRLVRTLNGTGRGFLSDGFRMLDNEIVFDGMYPSLKRLGAEIESANVSDDFMHIQAIFHHIEGELRVGDVVRYGVAIRNSEVGKGALSLSPLIYRLVCKNGAVLMDQTRRRTHIGGSYLEGDDLSWVALSSETQHLKIRATVAELGEYLEALSTPEKFQETLGMLRAVADQTLPAPPQQVIESLGARYSLVKGETDSALLALAEGRDYTRWGLSNALTQIANVAENYDRAIELESLGGRIMQMPKKDYEALAVIPRLSEMETIEGEVVHA